MLIVIVVSSNIVTEIVTIISGRLSFTLLGKTIDELGLEIQAGVYFKGTLNILEVEVFAEININTDPEALRIYAKVTVSPISWVGGRVKQKWHSIEPRIFFDTFGNTLRKNCPYLELF